MKAHFVSLALVLLIPRLHARSKAAGVFALHRELMILSGKSQFLPVVRSIHTGCE
jgi:hypothetical protein